MSGDSRRHFGRRSERIKARSGGAGGGDGAQPRRLAQRILQVGGDLGDKLFVVPFAFVLGKPNS